MVHHECVLSEAAEPAMTGGAAREDSGWGVAADNSGQYAKNTAWGARVVSGPGSDRARGTQERECFTRTRKSATRGTCASRAAERAAYVPRVAQRPGGRRSVRRTCHAWHMRQAGGGACGLRATRGTCARRAAEGAAYVPRVAYAPGKRRSVRRTCHAWHMRPASGGACGVRARQAAERAAYVPRVAHAPGGRRSVRSTCHAWHMSQAGGRVCGVRATCGTCARRAAERAAGGPRVAPALGRGGWGGGGVGAFCVGSRVGTSEFGHSWL